MIDGTEKPTFAIRAARYNEFCCNLHFCMISFPGFSAMKKVIELGYLQITQASLSAETVIRHINKQQRVAHVRKAVESC